MGSSGVDMYIPLAQGTRLQDRYEIESLIGVGGMGAVYKAKHLIFESDVAIKETRRSDSESSQAFLNEAKLLRELRNDALPQVHDFFTEQVDFEIPNTARLGNFLVMEYVPGNNLEEWLRTQSAPFNLEAVMVWADQILSALTYLHTRPKPIVHKDVKPSNLKVGDDNRVVLLDFGLSKNMDDGTFIYGKSKFYSSLEQCHNTQTDPRADLYSLAATVYFLLIGKPPPDAFDREAAVNARKTDPLDEFVMRNNSLVPALVGQQLSKAMSLKRQDRHASAAGLREELKKAWMNQTSEFSTIELPTIPRRISPAVVTPVVDDDEETVLPPLLTALKRRLQGHKHNVRCVTFSPAGDLLASGCENGDVGMWSVQSAKSQFIPKTPGVAVTGLAFSPDGRTLACSRLNNMIELWDVRTLELKWKFRTHGLEAHSLGFPPDGKIIAAGELCRPPTRVTLWDMTTLQLRQTFPGNGHFLVKSLSFSPDGKSLAVALWSRNTQTAPDRQGQVQLWEMATQRDTVLIDNARVNSIAFSPSGQMIACGCVDKTIRLVDVTSGSQVRTITGHQNSISTVAFHPRDGLLASSDFGESFKSAGKVTLWDVSTGLSLKDFDSQPGGVRAVTVSLDGKHLAFTEKNNISVYEMTSS